MTVSNRHLSSCGFGYYLTIQYFCLIPINTDITYELKRTITDVILRQIGSHLHRAVQHDVQCQLMRERRIYAAV